MDPRYIQETSKHLEKQQELLWEAYRSMTHELQKLQVEEEMLMRKFYEAMSAQGLNKKTSSKQEIRYITAVYWFKKTLAHIPSSLSVMWEPTVVNLAHALRKLRRYQEAISYYEKALTLSTRSLSTYAGLAYTYHLQDNYSEAITYYHKALWLKPDDQFCTEMLTLALADESRSGIDSITKSRRGELFL